MIDSANSRLERVLAQLRLYEHPVLDFNARSKGEGVEVIITFKNPSVPVHTYYFELHPRDLDHPQFEWSFQRQLYDCLHDYLVEMFIRTPQDRVERQQKGLCACGRLSSRRSASVVLFRFRATWSCAFTILSSVSTLVISCSSEIEACFILQASFA